MYVMTNPPEKVWQDACADLDLKTPEGRAAADNNARAFLSSIESETVRGHYESMIRHYRHRSFNEADRAMGFTTDEIQALAARLTTLEERVFGNLETDF